MKKKITYQAMNKLKKHGLNIENIRKTEQSKLQELIYPVGFYVRKAQFVFYLFIYFYFDY